MTSPVQNANPEADAYRAEQTAREQQARAMSPASSDVMPIQWPHIAPPNRGDPDIPWPAANPPTGGSISPPAPPNMSIYNYLDYAFATAGGWVASPGLPPWMWPAIFRTIPNRSPQEAELASQLPHPTSMYEGPPSVQATGQTAPAQSEQAQQFGRPAAQQMQQPSTQPAAMQPPAGQPAQPQAPAPGVPVRAPRPQRPGAPPAQPPSSPTARAGTTNPQTSPGAQNIPLQGGVRTQSGFAPPTPSSFGGGMRPITSGDGGGDGGDD